MKLTTFICIVLVAAVPNTAFGISLGGELSTAYEVSQNADNETYGTWENTLRIDNLEVISPYLGAAFYGKYTREDEESNTDIFSAFLQYSSFQRAIEVKLGRFSLVDNRFLTLDGAEFTIRTDYYVGATVFAGSPNYFDVEGRHINETFRDTGAELYGGKLFLNGVKDTTGYLSVSKEEDDKATVQELVNAGIGRSFSLGDTTFNTSGKMAYDTRQNHIYKGALRAYLKYGNLSVIVDGTRYDAREGINDDNELVLTNFSTGLEDRLSYTLQYGPTKNIIVYQSAAFTKIEVTGGEIVDGEIVKLGVDLDYFKKIGVTGNVEGYYYSSEVSDASGGSVVLDWNITGKFRLNIESEVLALDKSTDNETVYTLYFSTGYDIVKDFTVSIFGENNQGTKYLPENRYGIAAAYRF